MEKDVNVKILGVQNLKDQDESIVEFVTEGKLYDKGRAMYLVYEDGGQSETPSGKTVIKLMEDSIKMNRSGESHEAEMVFREGERHKRPYVTPYGEIEMEILTDRIFVQVDGNGNGRIQMDFQLSMGFIEGTNKVTIEIEPIN